jgi:hypothetical protein
MGLAPDVFWAMSLIEWRRAVAGFAERRGSRPPPGALALGRAELRKLMNRFPDSRF